MAASCSSHPSCKYEVFLSFRGEDTRRIFVCHLHRALKVKGIKTFIDSADLIKGNKLSELLRAIKDSRLSIIVFSRTYASSRWCLKELDQILQCMESTKKQIVVPIFYQVKPFHVRQLNGQFGKAFAEHQHDSNAQSWKSALFKASNLSGWESEQYKDDAELIENVVEDISHKLTPASTSKTNGLVGMDYHIHEMDSRLCLEVDDDRVVGICGIPGIGKTTIARAVYDKLACQFGHYHFFLEDVKKGFKNKSAVHMQEELLSGLSEKTGRKMTMEMLSQKKVLLVLDNVENFSQVEDLLGRQHSFAGGSRIIITTRDKQSLSQVNATTYSPKGLEDDEAYELFTDYAFGTSQPTGEYNRLAKLAVKYSHGLPLALKVLGAFLRGKRELEWHAEVKKIESLKIPHSEIQEVLKTSIDGLDDLNKNIFLDVACFFRGMDRGYVTKILDTCDFFPITGFRVLLDRALVTISYDNRLEMHDLLQEMGQEIARQVSIKEPGRRSRLCSYEDVNDVLTQNTATEAVEGIILDFSNSKDDLYINGDAFVNMTRLRLLKIVADNWSIENRNQHLRGNLLLPSHQLRLLRWDGCPLKFWPSNFSGKNLIDLGMRYSHIEQLWDGKKRLEKLKFIDLSHSQFLCKTPDFTEVPLLEKLILECCSSLYELHPSIAGLKNLVLLSLKGCRKLTILPISFHMKSLETLDLSGCSNLEKFPEISEVMKELSELYLDGTAIKELPPTIERLMGLHLLSMRNCRRLVSLHDNICNLAYLQQLHLDGCTDLYELPENLGNLESLTNLGVQDSGIKQLPVSILCLRNRSLSCKGCKKMRAPFSAWSLAPEDYVRYSCLVQLDLSDCNLLILSDCISLFSSLNKLKLCRNDMEHLPETMKRLRLLTHLELEACRSLKSIPELASSIIYIDAHDCTALERVSTPKSRHSTKLCFTFSNCKQLGETNLFKDTLETHPHYQVNQLQPFFNMSLPGSEIPYWFNHRNSEIPDSVTAPLPLNWFDKKFLGFAICAVFKGFHKNASALFAQCYCTFKGNHGEYKFNFPLLEWGFKTDRFLKSDHIFLGYVPWSYYRSVNECYYPEIPLIEEESPVNECYYTEATFKIQVRMIAEEHPCITSCGVHFFQVDFMEVQDQSTTGSESHHGSCDPLPVTNIKRKREKEDGTEKQRRGESKSLPTVESGTNDRR